MARGINKVILIGNLGQDPEIRYAPSGTAIANLSIATSDTWLDKQSGERQERTEWHRLVLFNKTAEVAGQYLKKGSKVYVEGRLQTRKWQGQDGQDRYTTEIVVGDMQMLGGNDGGQGGGQRQQQGGYGGAPQGQGQGAYQAPPQQPQQPPQQPRQPQQPPQRPMAGPDGRPDTAQRNEAPAPQQPGFDDFNDDIPF